MFFQEICEIKSNQIKSKFNCSNISHLHVGSGKTVYEQGHQSSKEHLQ